MKIRYLDQDEKELSRPLYEEVFSEDEKAFVDAYYEKKIPTNKILVLEEEKEIVSMIHLNPYTLSFKGREIETYYIVAVATKEEHRKKGYMRQLLTKALEDMKREDLLFTYLMPAADAIYTPYGFCRIGNDSKEEQGKKYDLVVKKDRVYEEAHISLEKWEETPLMAKILSVPDCLSFFNVTTEKAVKEILFKNTSFYFNEVV